MPAARAKLEDHLRRIDAALAALPPAAVPEAVARCRADAAAATFHLRRAAGDAALVVVIGGTGTGKSTLVNRLLGRAVTAASFRRTFTAGCVAVVSEPDALPPGWLGVEHVPAAEADLPARGAEGVLTVIPIRHPQSSIPNLVDTPDLDGDRPAHHAQADRAFRWATVVLFVVTPEKYQMTELLPYYRLARRYGLPAAFAMNKAEDRAVVDDYRGLLARHDWPEATAFVVPRDDAALQPQPGAGLDDLRAWVAGIPSAPANADGLAARARDLAGRARDQVAGPLRESRRAVDEAVARLRALESPPPGVDVNPLTLQLQRRMQQRSVLYLMGPQRVLDRVRQVPSLLARLPRAAWDYVATGELPRPAAAGFGPAAGSVPDFCQLLNDAFAVVRSRVDDAVRALPALAPLLADPSYANVFLPADRAGRIADEELAALKAWLTARWDAHPRDTRVVQKLLKALPGGDRLSQWSEAAPYLLAVVVATHHVFLGPVDLVILGGYGLATWLTERASNEVAARTRAANKAIADRFTRLAHEQVTATCAWLNARAADARAIDALEREVDGLEESVDA